MRKVNVYSVSKDSNTKLSNNFRVREFACCDGSDPVFIDPALVEILQKVRDHFGKAVYINSGYRTVSYNKKLDGSATKSQHLYGMAADISIKGIAPAEVHKFVCTLLPNSGGIGLYPSFVHIDTRTEKSRWNG